MQEIADACLSRTGKLNAIRPIYPMAKMTHVCVCLLLAGVLALLPACRTTGEVPYSTALARDLILYDSNGRVVLCADFQWPQGLLTPGRNFAGKWYPAWMASRVRGWWTLGPDNAAAYHAEMAAENMSVDLSLGQQVDENVFLVGRQAKGMFTGKWYLAGQHGAQAMGRFTLRYETPPPQ